MGNEPRSRRLRAFRRALASGLIAASLSLCAAATAAAEPFDRDPSFGDGGSTILDEPGAANEQLLDLVVLPDGKVLGAGSRGGSSGFLLARVNPDGTPDAGFGGDGIKVEPDEGAIGDPRGISAIVRRPDGKLVAAGLGRGGTNAIQVARYLGSGDLDASFGSGGMTTVEVAPFSSARDVALAPDGSIVAVGGTGAGSVVVVAKLLENGLIDEGFDPFGYIHFDVPGSSSEEAEAVTVLGDGRMVIGGRSSEGALLVQLDEDGNPVPGFGAAGIAIADTGSGESPSGTILDLHVLDDGKIVVAGRSAGGGPGTQGFVARFTAGGDLDPSFATGGVYRVKQTAESDQFTAIEPLPDGRILAAGRRGSGPATSGETWLLRLTADGQPDPSFAPNGLLVADLAAGTDGAMGLALQPDGRPVVAGLAHGGGGSAGLELLFARFAEQPAQAPPVVLPPPPPAPPPPVVRCGKHRATVVGTPRRDVLRGTRKRDVIVGFGGNDRILAFAGNDVVCAGAGRDRVLGGRGRDWVNGQAGPDVLLGGGGIDLLLGAGGRDALFGGHASDRLFGNVGRDRLGGGPGRRDLCNGGAGRKDLASRSCERRRRVP